MRLTKRRKGESPRQNNHLTTLLGETIVHSKNEPNQRGAPDGKEG